MRMEAREIDVNFRVRKVSRNNTVMITFSVKRFKRFLFASRKRLRQNLPEQCESLYVNENLTSYNFSLLRTLKAEKKRRIEANETSFGSVYSFEGKIFVKKLAATDETASCISTKRDLRTFLTEFDNS